MSQHGLIASDGFAEAYHLELQWHSLDELHQLIEVIHRGVVAQGTGQGVQDARFTRHLDTVRRIHDFTDLGQGGEVLAEVQELTGYPFRYRASQHGQQMG